MNCLFLDHFKKKFAWFPMALLLVQTQTLRKLSKSPLKCWDRLAVLCILSPCNTLLQSGCSCPQCWCVSVILGVIFAFILGHLIHFFPWDIVSSMGSCFVFFLLVVPLCWRSKSNFSFLRKKKMGRKGFNALNTW